MSHRTTDELMNVLHSVHSMNELQEFTDEVKSERFFSSFADFLSYHIDNQQITASDLIRSAGIQRNYAYQILNGTKNPGRNKIIAFCLALKLPIDDVQRALTIAGESVLYPKRSRDSVLIFSITHGLSVQETNELLYEMKAELL